MLTSRAARIFTRLLICRYKRLKGLLLLALQAPDFFLFPIYPALIFALPNKGAIYPENVIASGYFERHAKYRTSLRAGILIDLRNEGKVAKQREFSSAGSEHLPYKQRVGGSIPSTPTSVAEANLGNGFGLEI
jgi:hypothetical protein